MLAPPQVNRPAGDRDGSLRHGTRKRSGLLHSMAGAVTIRLQTVDDEGGHTSPDARPKPAPLSDARVSALVCRIASELVTRRSGWGPYCLIQECCRLCADCLHGRGNLLYGRGLTPGTSESHREDKILALAPTALSLQGPFAVLAVPPKVRLTEPTRRKSLHPCVIIISLCQSLHEGAMASVVTINRRDVVALIEERSQCWTAADRGSRPNQAFPSACRQPAVAPYHPAARGRQRGAADRGR